MSAANAPLPNPSLEAERRSHEPSMEEILASIRRIIADDDSLPAMRTESGRAEEASAGTVAEADEELEHEERAAEQEDAQIIEARGERWPRPIYPPAVEPPEPRGEADEARWGAPAPQPRSETPARENATARRDSSESVSDRREPEDRRSQFRRPDAPTFQNFAAPAPEPPQTLVSPDAAAAISSHFQALAASMIINDSDLLHRYAQEMLRPMLKQWLDDNLPVLVERLVRAEIERVARGRR